MSTIQKAYISAPDQGMFMLGSYPENCVIFYAKENDLHCYNNLVFGKFTIPSWFVLYELNLNVASFVQTLTNH